MSSLPQSSPELIAPAAAPLADSRSLVWRDFRAAAKLLGISEGQCRRKCRVEWQPRGVAEQRPPCTGRGRDIWWIREDAEPGLARVKTVSTLNDQFDLGLLPDKQRKIILAREEAVKAYRLIKTSYERGQWREQLETFVAQRRRAGEALCSASVYSWDERYTVHGRAGLVDGRIRGAGEVRAGDPVLVYPDFFRELEAFYLDENEPTKATAFKLASRIAKKNGWPVPHSKTSQRHLAGLDLAKSTRGRKGADAFANGCGAFIARDYTRINIDGAERAMCSDDIWCGDHHICDTLVMYQGKLVRPWLTAWEDVRSRMIRGYRFQPFPADSTSVLLAIRAGILDSAGTIGGLRIPRFVYTDNGKDFDCWMLNGITKWERKQHRVEHDVPRFKSVFQHLQIGVMHAIPFNAKAKPVERFFGRYEQQFGKLTHTYCGKDPQSKPPHLDERLKRGEAPGYEEYVLDATRWIEHCYHRDLHLGHGMEGQSPEQVYAANVGEIRTTTREALEICLSITSRPVKVGRNGIRWDGRDYGRGDPALTPWFGKEVQLRVDEQDVTRVSIYAQDGSRICIAANVELANWGTLPDEKSKRIHAEVRRSNKALSEASRFTGMRMKISPLDVLLEDAMRGRSDEATERRSDEGEEVAPPTLKLVQTGFEGGDRSDEATKRRSDEGSAEPRKISAIDKLMRTAQAAKSVEQRRDPWAKATQMREAANAG